MSEAYVPNVDYSDYDKDKSQERLEKLSNQGVYLVESEDMKEFPSKDGLRVTISEFKILEAYKLGELEPHEVNERYKIMDMPNGKFKDLKIKNKKKEYAAALGKPIGQLKSGDIQALTVPGASAGLKYWVVGIKSISKGKKLPFMKCEFFPAELSAAKVQTKAAELLEEEAD